MASIDFPNSPSVDDTFEAGGRTWVWNGTVWNTVTTSISDISGVSPITYNSATAEIGISLTEGTGIDISGGTISVDTSVIAELNSPTFTGLTDFAGIVDFSEAVVLGIDALPSQTGEAGNYLTTDGTNASWSPVPAQSPHPFSMIG